MARWDLEALAGAGGSGNVGNAENRKPFSKGKAEKGLIQSDFWL
jgi:hypothetical protein